MLPFLPGYHQDMIPHGKRSYRKTHMFDVNNGIRVDCNRDVSLREQRSFPLNYQNPLAIHSVARDFEDKSDAKFAPEDTMSRLPAWVAYDRKVLRFFCSFKEDVTSSAIETWRVRNCVLYFYLEDDSIHIAEPKVENSGIPQGVFIKRHRIINDKNQYITVNDLDIGADLTIYGRVFHLMDCDDFTRAFYASQGKELGPAEDYPIDAFTKKATTVHKKTNKKLMNPLKHFMEASLGKPMGLNVDATQQFLQYDRKVLRFYSVWCDEKMFGERRPYVVHYFLADDTVEVLEIMQPNSGRDSFPAMLKRQKLPMDYRDKAPTIPRIGLHKEPNTKYYAAKDFKVGGYIVVYGRKLFICG